MTFATQSRRFSTKFRHEDPINSEWRLYEIKVLDRERVVSRFTGRVTRTQAARPNVEGVIERWCKLFPDKLPKTGEVVSMDLDHVERISDRR